MVETRSIEELQQILAEVRSQPQPYRDVWPWRPVGSGQFGDYRNVGDLTLSLASIDTGALGLPSDFLSKYSQSAQASRQSSKYGRPSSFSDWFTRRTGVDPFAQPTDQGMYGGSIPSSEGLRQPTTQEDSYVDQEAARREAALQDLQDLANTKDPDVVRNLEDMATIAIQMLSIRDEDGEHPEDALQQGYYIMHLMKDVPAFVDAFEVLSGHDWDEIYEEPDKPGFLARGVGKFFQGLRWGEEVGFGLIGDIVRGRPKDALGRAMDAGGDVGKVLLQAMEVTNPLEWLDQVIETTTGDEVLPGLAEFGQLLDKGINRISPEYQDISEWNTGDDPRTNFWEAIGKPEDTLGGATIQKIPGVGGVLSEGLDVIGSALDLPIIYPLEALGKLVNENFDIPSFGNLGGWLGRDASAGGTIDFAASILADPTTYVTLGTGRAAKQAAGTIEKTLTTKGITWLDDAERLGLARILANIRNSAVPYLDDAQKALVRKVLMHEAVEESATTFTERNALKLVERQLKNLDKSVGGGVRWAGLRVPGTQKASSAFKTAAREGDKPLLTRFAVDSGGHVVEEATGFLRQFARGAYRGFHLDNVSKAVAGLRRTFSTQAEGGLTNILLDEPASKIHFHLNSIARAADLDTAAMEMQLANARRKAAKHLTKRMSGVTYAKAEKLADDWLIGIKARINDVVKDSVDYDDYIRKLDIIVESLESEIDPALLMYFRTAVSVNLNMMDTAIRLGADPKRFFSEFAYNPRVLDRKTKNALSKIMNSPGPERDFLELLMRSDTNAQVHARIDDTVARMGLTINDDAISTVRNMLDAIREQLADPTMLDGFEEHLKDKVFNRRTASYSRKVFKETQNIEDINNAILDYMKAEKEAYRLSSGIDVDLPFQTLYTSDPVEAYIQTYRDISKENFTHRALIDISDVDITSRFGVTKGYEYASEMLDGRWREIPRGKNKGDKVHEVLYDGEWVEFDTLKKRLGKKGYNLWAPEKGTVVWSINNHIDNELNRIYRRFKGNDASFWLPKMLDKWTSIWAIHATIPIVNPKFFSRNTYSNWFSMMANGVNLAKTGKGIKVQRLAWKVRKLIKEDPKLSFDDALARFVKSDPIEVEYLLLAREHGVLDSSFFTDWVTDRLLFESDSKFVSLMVDNPFTNLGRAVNSSVENNARLTTFIDGLDKGMSPYRAAQRTHFTMFDYNDITTFEREKIRRVSRFYTWMRKNLELQTRLMASRPGYMINLQKATNNIVGAFLGNAQAPIDPTNLLLPDYMETFGQVYSGNLGASYETPLSSAIDTYLQLSSTLATLPIMRDAIPEWAQMGNTQDNIDQFLSLFASSPTNVVLSVMENRAGFDFFTGRPLATLDKYEKTMRWAEQLLPSLPRFVNDVRKLWDDKTIEDYDPEKDDEVDPELEYLARMANMIFGLRAYDVGQDRQEAQLRRLRFEADEALNELRKKGHDIPTVTELRDAGDIIALDTLTQELLFGDRDIPLEERLIAALPADVVDQFPQLWQYLKETNRDDIVDADEMVDRLADYYSVIKYMTGEDPDIGIRVALLGVIPGRPDNAAWEAGGYEPIQNYASKFSIEDTHKLREAEITEYLEKFGPVVGVTPEQVKEVIPRLTEIDRDLLGAKLAGWSDEKFLQYMIDNLSRTRTGLFFGTDALEKYDFEKGMDAEERKAFQLKTWNEIALFTYFAQAYGVRYTQRDIAEYVTKSLMSQGYLEAAGLEKRMSIPNRKDPRTEQEYYEDAMEQAELIFAQLPELEVPREFVNYGQ